MKQFLTCFFFVFFFTFSSIAADLQFQKIEHNGLARSFYYYLPHGVKPSSPTPLLFSLHGGGKADGDEYADRLLYNQIADRDGLIVIYPNGMEAQWNDGRGVTFRGIADNSHVDDVGYISMLIDYAVKNYNADPSRIYVEGSSNGGMMTQRIACNLAGKITAAASVIASMPANIRSNCHPKAALPMLLMNATTDPWVPFEGGSVTPLGKDSGKIISTWDTINFWVAHNRCNKSAVPEDLPDVNKRDDSHVKRYVYDQCKDGVQVVLYEVIGAGHSRPGMKGFVPKRMLGEKNNDINASEEIWAFFRQFSK